MPSNQPPAPDDDDGFAEVSIPTAHTGQRLTFSGWYASRADSGNPGPHVHLHASDGGPVVVRSDQVSDVVAALTTVAERIERQYAVDGEQYAEEVVRRAPHPEDPQVITEVRRGRLAFKQAVLEHLPDVMRAITQASSTDEAIDGVARLLDVDEVEVMVGLARFDLLSLTRPATERRLEELAQD